MEKNWTLFAGTFENELFFEYFHPPQRLAVRDIPAVVVVLLSVGNVIIRKNPDSSGVLLQQFPGLFAGIDRQEELCLDHPVVQPESSLPMRFILDTTVESWLHPC